MPLSETLHLLALVVAAISSGLISFFFWFIFQRERKIKTLWRVTGFGTVAAGFLLEVVAWRVPEYRVLAYILQLVGFWRIYNGVYAEPSLSHLRTIASYEERIEALPGQEVRILHWWQVAAALLGFSSLLILAWFTPVFVSFWLLMLITGSIATTMWLQWRRLGWEYDSAGILQENLYPLIGYSALCLYYILAALAAWPATQMLPSLLAIVGNSALLLGFVFLFLWAWVFIRVRRFFRIPLVAVIVGVIAISLAAAVTVILLIGGFAALTT